MPVSYSGDGISFADGTNIASGRTGFINRVINGDMRIDQRNAGASVSASGSYPIDRFMIVASQASKFTAQQNAGSVTPPAGFTNYLGITSSSSYTVSAGDYFSFQQYIEGSNIADLGWGTANAKTVTLSFWARSSLTGTFGGALRNEGASRCYPFTYTISSANTWEYKTVTIAGDTTGTWLTTNGRGIGVQFGLGVGSTFSGTAGAWASTNYVTATGATSVVGTNGATFYITGVDLRAGTYTTAPTWEFRSIGQELALCQRYYYRLTMSQYTGNGSGLNDSTTACSMVFPYPVTMRTSPSALEQNGTPNDYSIRIAGSSFVLCSAVPTFATANTQNGAVNFTVASGLTAGQSVFLRASGTAPYLGWSAEL